MDKIKKYQHAISELLEEYRSYLAGANMNQNDERFKTIVDLQHNHFQLLISGWKDKKHTFMVAFHLDIINNKIWLQQNNTEFYVADELIEKGVAREDIVLGFIDPQARQYTGFAVA